MVSEYTDTELQEIEDIVNYNLYNNDEKCMHFSYDNIPANIIKIPFIFSIVLEIQSLIDSTTALTLEDVDIIAKQFNCTVKKKKTYENIFIKLITVHCQPLNCVEFVFDHVSDPELFMYFVR